MVAVLTAAAGIGCLKGMFDRGMPMWCWWVLRKLRRRLVWMRCRMRIDGLVRMMWWVDGGRLCLRRKGFAWEPGILVAIARSFAESIGHYRIPNL